MTSDPKRNQGQDQDRNEGQDRNQGRIRDEGRDEGRDTVAEVLSALADPTRRRILDALAAHGEATATVLSTELPVSRQAIVKHLGVLDQAGLVAGHRAGREARYRVIPARLGVTARWMDRLAADWDTRLSAIKQLAEDPAVDAPPAESRAPEQPKAPQPENSPP